MRACGVGILPDGKDLYHQLTHAGYEQLKDEEPILVVGVGASAGGLDAFERLFAEMPTDTGMAFVLLQHLSPDHKSLMDELLSRRTSIPICEAVNNQPLRRDHIYWIPAQNKGVISGGCLLLTDRDPAEGLTYPIDHFFRSLAHDYGPRAVAIVLSGTLNSSSIKLL